MNNTPPASRILIVDDHPAVREGLAVRISHQADLIVCGEASDVDEALALVASSTPDLIIVWSMYDDVLYASRVQRAGAMGYVNKCQATDGIITAIRRVLAGGHYFEQQVPLVSRAATTTVDDGADVALPLQLLSDRELEVFRYLGRGLATQEVAACLGVSRKTVETYRSRIKEKFKLSSGTELLRLAIRAALIEGQLPTSRG